MHPVLDEIVAVTGGNKAYLGSIYENIVAMACRMIPIRRDSVLDAGANKGRHMVNLAEAVCAAGTVYAVEPLPAMLKILKRKIRRRRLRQVTLISKALSDRPGKTSFHYFANKPAYSGLIRRSTYFSDAEGDLRHIQVHVVTLDDLLAKAQRLSLMKLDLEGGEFHALLGARQTIIQHQPVILFEHGFQQSANDYGYKPDQFFRFFADIGYQLFTITGELVLPDHWSVGLRCWQLVALPQARADEAERFQAYAQVAVVEHQAHMAGPLGAPPNMLNYRD